MWRDSQEAGATTPLLHTRMSCANKASRPFGFCLVAVNGDGFSWLRKDDRLLGVADRFESRFQRGGHRRGTAEKDHGVRTGRR